MFIEVTLGFWISARITGEPFSAGTSLIRAYLKSKFHVCTLFNFKTTRAFVFITVDLVQVCQTIGPTSFLALWSKPEGYSHLYHQTSPSLPPNPSPCLPAVGP